MHSLLAIQLIMFDFSASWLALNTVSVLAIIWTNQFYVNNGFMIILISMNICCGLLASVYGDLFPTHLRYVDCLM